MSDSRSPLYRQVGEKLAALMKSGVLRPGDRMPSIRRAREQHGISTSTAMGAYEWLENQGLIEARPRSGYFVRRSARVLPAEPRPSRPAKATTSVGVGVLQAKLFEAARQSGIVPLGAAFPGADLFPAARLSRMMASISRRMGGRGLAYEMAPGSERLRRQIALRSLDWGSRLSPEEIITTCGGTEALMLCLRAVTVPGDVVAVEAPSYFGILQLVEELGLKAVEIPMHPRDGMQVEALADVLATRRIAACISVPNFSNPLGSLMPDERKQQLLALLNRYAIPLIEDDIHGDLHFGPHRPRVIQSWDTAGRVMLCGSFSKTLAPGYRVGWVAPGHYYDRVLTLKLTSTLATPTVPQETLAEYLMEGGYDHHLRSIREIFLRQIEQMREAVARAFPEGVKMTRPAGGFVLWVELPPQVKALDLYELAIAGGISIAPGPMFSARRQFQNFIRLNCGHRWNPSMERAIRTLGGMARSLGK